MAFWEEGGGGEEPLWSSFSYQVFVLEFLAWLPDIFWLSPFFKKWKVLKVLKGFLNFRSRWILNETFAGVETSFLWRQKGKTD